MAAGLLWTSSSALEIVSSACPLSGQFYLQAEARSMEPERLFRVMTRRRQGRRGRSAPGGEAEGKGRGADAAARRSAIGGRAVLPARWPGGLGEAMNGQCDTMATFELPTELPDAEAPYVRFDERGGETG